MNIALAQINCHIGNFEHNCSKIIDIIGRAEKEGVDIVVFPELAVTGYPPLDLLEYDGFIEKCYKSIDKIAASCTNVAALVGSPASNDSPKGKRLYNSAFFLAEGKVKQVFHKGLLPNYDVFDEYRYFEPAGSFKTIEFKGKNIAVTICEDVWSLDEKTLYVASPMEELAKQKPDILINIAASPFSYNQHLERKNILAKNALKYILPVFYVNHIGAHTDLIFDGGSMVIDSKGKIVHEMKYFEEDYYLTNVDAIKNSKGKQVPTETVKDEKIKLIHDGLVMGLRDYFQKSGFTKAILGLSGGLDSAVVLAIAVKALGNNNVKALLMPSQFSSDHSVKDAVELALNLNTSYDILHIKELYHKFDETLKPFFKDFTFGSAEENIQARTRALLLMAYSNKYNYVLLNTSNKSESAVGYTTLYGDMCGGLSVLGDVYKTDVYKLADYINRTETIIPENTINKPPSAELSPGQKDTDSLPEYDLLDQILYNYIELQMGSNDIIKKGFEAEIVNKVLSLVDRSEHKRHQTPPILRVSPKAFGRGRRIPLVAKYD